MIENILEKYFNIECDTRMQPHIQIWRDWYKGENAFHKYSVYNGQSKVGCKRDSLRMPKRIAEDWANLLMNEKVDINTDNEETNKRLKAAFTANDFYVRANALVEQTFALGTGAMVEYADALGNPVIDFVTADKIYPISWDGANVTECAFASRKYIHGKAFYYINIHLLGNDGYVVHNRMYSADDCREAALPKGTERTIETLSFNRRYQILRPNIVDNIEENTPMGISVIANAISEVKGVDLVYDSLINEFKLGKKRIFVPETMVQHQQAKDGIINPIFDTNDTVFYSLPGSTESEQKPIESNMSLRTAEHISALQTTLELLASKCGLGSDRYIYKNGGVKTATEVVSDKSELYQNLKKHEIVFRSALISLTTALAEIMGIGEVTTKVDFDDSIIEDKDAEFKRDMQLVSIGAMKNYEVRSKCLNEPLDTAKAQCAEAQVDNIFEE